jgi:hypothetical protein
VEYELEAGEDGRTKAIKVSGPEGAAPQVRRSSSMSMHRLGKLKPSRCMWKRNAGPPCLRVLHICVAQQPAMPQQQRASMSANTQALSTR